MDRDLDRLLDSYKVRNADDALLDRLVHNVLMAEAQHAAPRPGAAGMRRNLWPEMPGRLRRAGGLLAASAVLGFCVGILNAQLSPRQDGAAAAQSLRISVASPHARASDVEGLILEPSRIADIQL